MLPDFPAIKNDLQDAMTLRLRNKVRMGDPVIAMTPHTLQHEGDKKTYETVQRDQKAMNYKRIEATFSIKREEMRTLTVEQILERVDAAAEEMTRQMATSMFAAISQATDEVGNTVDNAGQPFTFDTLLQGLEKIEIDFDPVTGKPQMPSMVMSPELYEKVKDKLPGWEADPDCNARFETLMKKKRDEWNDRESHRKLVD